MCAVVSLFEIEICLEKSSTFIWEINMLLEI